MSLFIQASLREWELSEDRAFRLVITVSPGPGPMSGAHWELHKYLIAQTCRCFLPHHHPQCFQHMLKMTGSKDTSFPPLTKVGLAQKRSDPAMRLVAGKKTEAKKPQNPQAVTTAPGKTVLSGWLEGVSQCVPIKAHFPS